MSGFDWQHYWPHVVFATSILVGVGAALHAAMTKDDVRAATGWVGVIIFSPIFGAVFYLLAGINRIRRSQVSQRRHAAELRHAHAHAAPRPPPEAPLAPVPAPVSPAVPVAPEPPIRLAPVAAELASLRRLGDHVASFPLTDGNEVRLLDSGDEAYPAMLAAIAAAERSIALQSYIFDDDAVGRQFADALVAAHQRGVAVRVLIDAVGARYSRPPITRRLSAGGVTTATFMGNLIGFRLPYANLRSHRKVLVIDGTVGFTGGMNIRGEFMAGAGGPARSRDTHFRVEGPVVAQLFTAFSHDWYFTTEERLSGPEWAVAAAPRADGVAARVVPSGPDRNLSSNHTIIMGALAVARERVRIASPYFIPDLQLVGALTVAARRGIAVDVVIPAANNLPLVDHAMTAQLDQVVRAGCRVWRAEGMFDHSKLMAVDGQWAYVGSSNLDSRSLRLNFELDIEVYDPVLAEAVDARIEAQIAQSRPETMETLKARPFPVRVRNRAVWLASPYL
ncbi:phospholipase D-like domain-containing protein [Pseudoxanthobacter sp. M-2]|uniref:phospholipase D-like domain-containing protein n=1 Tax=Pseudoxanthobacter sp. M-2 TaxID=3078754 RepID=UPI0038FC971A